MHKDFYASVISVFAILRIKKIQEGFSYTVVNINVTINILLKFVYFKT